MSDEIEQFLIYLATERGLSANYQAIVQRSLETFAGWASARGLALKIIEPGHITDFLAFRKRSGLQASSVRLDAVAVRIFFRFLVSRQGWPVNPAESLSLPRPEKHLPETLNPCDVRRLIESVGPGDPQGARDRAMLELSREVSKLSDRLARTEAKLTQTADAGDQAPPADERPPHW